MRWAFVTGGGGDIGGAICATLAERGFGIACVDLDAARADAVGARISAAGGRALAIAADVADEHAVVRAAQQALAQGDVRVLVNCAGRAHAATMQETDYGSWRRDIAINLDSAFLCTRALQDHLLDGAGGAIVNIASVNGLGAFGNPGYSAAKAGLIHFTRCLAVEYGAFGVRVNAIAPGTVRTRAWDARRKANPHVFDDVQRLYPLGRVSRPADIAALAAFLVSEEAAMITGAVLPVDGGITAGMPDVPAIITQRPRAGARPA